jgi:hypothetical protein
MPFNFLPKNVKFFEFFKEESKMLEEASESLVKILSGGSDSEEIFEKINELEEKCHKTVRTVNHELYKNFLTPLDREDIHEINRRHYDVIHLIKSVSIRVGLLDLPKITSTAKDLSVILDQMIKEIKTLIDGLEKIKDMDNTITKIESMRKQATTLVRLAYAELYEGPREKPEDVLYILQWTQIYDLIMNAIEKTDNLVTVIEGVILKNG